MPVEFFNFGSHEAYCLFCWLTTERKDELDAMIARAFELAESEPMFEYGVSPSLCARDALADYLSDEYLPRQFQKNHLFADLGCNLQDGTEGLRSITEQLVVLAANRISYTAVAEALLKYCDKWAPDRDRREIL